MAAAVIPAELSANLQGLPANADVRLASLTDWAMVRVIDALIDQVGIESVMAMFNAAFDAYIAPLVNIPGVSDETLKSIAGGIIRGFHALVHTDKAEAMKAAAAPRTWIGEAA